MKFFLAKALVIFSVIINITAQNAQSTPDTASSSEKLRQIVAEVISHAEKASLYRGNVDWESLRKEIHKKAENAKTEKELAPAFTLLLARLNDPHGKFYYQNNQFVAWFGEVKEHQKKMDPKMWGEIQGGRYKFKSQQIGKNLGYIRIVGMPTGDNVKMSQEIRRAVCELKNKKVNKWIVDLRYNGGGNMFPMLEGIAPIIGDGLIGGAKNADGKSQSVWTIRDSDFYYDDYLAADLPDDCNYKSALPKVAVLVSSYTASSGEAVAVAFKGRAKTRFFGEKTFGFTTVTDYKPLNQEKDLAMSISVAYFADRNGTIYRNFVDVDEEVEFVQSENLNDDAAVNKAINWLR